MLSGTAMASSMERPPLVEQAKQAEKHDSSKKVRVFDAIKKNETTRLPDTARREDARGGFLI